MDGSECYKGGTLQKLFELNLNVPSNHPDFILPVPEVSFSFNMQIQLSLKGTDTELLMEKGGRIQNMPLFIFITKC